MTLSAVGAATPLLPAAAAAAQRDLVDERANTTAWLVPAANASAAAVLDVRGGDPALQELEVEVFAGIVGSEIRIPCRRSVSWIHGLRPTHF